MKKNDLFKAIGICFLIFVLLSWVIPTGSYATGEYVKANISAVGLIDLLYYPIVTFGTFIQYGVFSSLESMERETIELENYVYNIDKDMYYVYVGITKNEQNANKIMNYYKNLGYDTILKQYDISNDNFLEEVENYDNILLSTEDQTAIASLINQILTKYEEVVINGKD